MQILRVKAKNNKRGIFMDNRHSMLGNESISRLIVKFSIPAVAGMTVSALYNVIDRIFVGRGVGSDALSGVVVTFPVMMIILGFSLLLSVGTASMVSIKLGQKKKDAAENIIGNAFTLSMLLGIILSTACYLFMKPLLMAFGGEGAPLLYAEQFMQVALFSIVFQMIGFTLNGAIRSEGNAIIALLTLIIGNAINLILNPLFIFVLHLGVRGSALATLISQCVTAAWTFFYFVNKKSLLRLRIKNLRLKPVFMKEILSIGLAPFILQNALSLMLIISNLVFKKFGDGEGLAAVGIITVISMLFN
jgi:putative MATE family efflux protein